MKKVLFLINTLNTGGAERVLVDLAAKLPKDQYEVTVQALCGGSFQNQLPEHVIYRQMVKIKHPALSGLFMKIFSKLPKLTGRLFIKKGYDLEVAYLEGFPTKVIAKHKSRGKKLAFVHTNVAQADIISVQYPNKEACLQQYKAFDRVCFVSRQAMEGFYQVIGELDHGQVIHNVVDVDRVRRRGLEQAPERYAISGLKLVCVGRLIDLKGFDRLIRICAQLEQEFDFEVFILGDGDQRAALEEELAKTGCKSVRLVGMQENPYAWMQQADLLVCSSFSEGYSTTIVEALALGLPVITTACAGMKEILEDGKWGMITGLSDEELRAGLRTILEDRNVYDDLKRRAMTRKEQLTAEASIGEYLQLFEQI